MLFLVFCIAAFTAIHGDLLEVSYDIDENYFDTFTEIQCSNATQWDLVAYGHLELVPPYEGRSLGIRALNDSCSTSFPIVIFKGTLELTVYLRTISKYSGITVAVLDERSEPIVSVRYQKSNRNYVPGWVVVSLPIETHTTGYVQLSGQSLNIELVIVDSFRYIPGNSTYIQSEENTKTVSNNEITSTPTTLVPEQPVQVDEFVFEFDENGSGDEDDLEGSGEYETGPSVTDDPDNPTGDPGTGTEYPPNNTTEDPVTEDPVTEDPNNPTEPGSGTEDPNIDSSTEVPGSEDTENSEDEYWNVFTITFVTVGVFTAVGLLGVGSYYLGKNRALSQNPPLDWEALEPPSEPPITVPRARSVFSEATYDRFSRYS